MTAFPDPMSRKGGAAELKILRPGDTLRNPAQTGNQLGATTVVVSDNDLTVGQPRVLILLFVLHWTTFELISTGSVAILFDCVQGIVTRSSTRFSAQW